jgi:hypothetical protein
MDYAHIVKLDAALAAVRLVRVGRLLAGDGDDSEVVDLVCELAEVDGAEVEYGVPGLVAFRPSDAIWKYIN